jgi:tetratricopeptide (TPR) repeat protein
MTDARDAEAFNRHGVRCATRGRYAEAVEAFSRALALDPRMRAAAWNLEITAGQPNATALQQLALAERLEAHPGDRGARLELARLERLVGNRAAAIRLLAQLLAEDADDPAVLLERGLVDHRAGELKRAEQWYARAAIAGQLSDARRLLAEVLYQTGRSDEALRIIEQHLRAEPDQAEAHRLRAFILGDLGRVAEAREASARASALQPVHDRIDESTLPAAVNPRSPVDVLAEPTGALAHYGLGLAFRQRGYLQEARLEFERASAIGEGARLVDPALAELDLLDGRASAARARYELLLLDGEVARWWNEHGVALHQLGEQALAADSYRRAIRSDPRYALAYNNLGVAQADLGNGDAAVQAFRRAVEIDPSLPRLQRNLARALLAYGDPLAAIGVLRDWLAFHGDDAAAWRLSSEAHRALDRHEDADAAHERAEALEPFDAVRPSRLSVAIEAQQECPSALGDRDLLTIALTGVASDASVAAADAARWTPRAVTRVEADADEAPPPADVPATVEVPGVPEELPADPEARRSMARALCLDGRGAEALPVIRQLAREQPEDPELLVLYAAGRLDAPGFSGGEAARRALLRLASLDVSSAALLHFAGALALQLPDEGLALGFFRRSLAVDPARPSPRVAVARLLAARGNWTAARLELVAALAVAPDWSDAVGELARLHLAQGHPELARDLLVGYLLRAPRDGDALALLVESLLAMAQEDAARAAVERLGRVAPLHPAVRWFDGVLLEKAGRHDEARMRWAEVALMRHAGDWSRRARMALERGREVAVA